MSESQKAVEKDRSLSPAEAPAAASAKKIDHFVVLIHGIRTHAAWAEMVVAVLEDRGAEDRDTVEAIPLRYHFFDAFRFLSPFLTRKGPVERIVQELRDLRDAHPDAKISVIAHSFGTYIVQKALEERNIRLHRVIFCGSVVREGFRRADYKGQLGDDEILNDCGTNDVWPVLARSVTWGYGSTGTFGFGTFGVHDRFNKFGHGDYFNKAYVEKFWRPFIYDGEIRPTEWETVRKNPPWWLSALSWIPLKYFLLAGIIALILGFFGWLLGPSQIRIGCGPEITVGHYMGVPAVKLPVHFKNTGWRETLVEDLRFTLISPGGREVALQVEGIVFGMNLNPAGDTMLVRPREPASYTYSFFNYNPGFQAIQQQVYNEMMAANLSPATPADPSKELVSKELVGKILTFGKAQFIWTSGKWRVRVSGRNGSHLIVAEKTMTLSQAEVDGMWRISDHYRSGIGVFPGWGYLTLGDYQPTVGAKLEEPQ
ncbi:MAG TPA: alpha/beta hydrolase [Chthoniobacterales bacterium]|nr:alpha/beta hydrolase [Chthoniobacterales bacterium]